MWLLEIADDLEVGVIKLLDFGRTVDMENFVTYSVFFGLAAAHLLVFTW